MSNIQKQHKISPAIAWLTIQKFIIFYCPLDGEHTKLGKGNALGNCDTESLFNGVYRGAGQEADQERTTSG